ncbi:hypothetical protein [Paraferrimonas sedimenticola]|uniref:Uncharacterized protein n=1 Tax=Paraferrimonas sedimenticola TaxID=375674 RepID=A0AA37RZV1_9GAMM|nr:hypothetical protein [Paraferrimonas sedimenticola]GLP98114.1 hypothetical protein GCM10007895_34210 [Paraferrimonas sedimenticola]
MQKMVSAALLAALALVTTTANAKSTWIGMVGWDNAHLVKGGDIDPKAARSQRNQVDLIAHGVNLQFAGMTWENTTGLKVNLDGKLTVGRNWAYGYWNDNWGMSVDLIKGDWQGTGPSIAAAGLAYKNCSGALCFRVNPTLARVRVKTGAGDIISNGHQLNLRLDYAVNDRLSLRFHPQYQSFQDDRVGSTVKFELSATVNLSEDKRHKLILMNETYLVNNANTDGRTRWVGENSPLPGLVPGTEANYKVRYAYVF